MKFSSEQQLQEFLGTLNSNYCKYAAALWEYGVTSADELCNGSVDALIAAGISNRLHAENIKTKAVGVTGGAAEAAGAAGDGARDESEMKASLAEVFSLTVIPFVQLLRFIKPASAVMKRGCKGNPRRDQAEGYEVLLHPHAD